MEPEAYCFHKNFNPGGPTEFQMDRHYLLYAREGTIRMESAGQRWTLPPARAALIAAGHPITITVLSKLTSASVLFAPKFMATPSQTLSVFDVSPLARELILECRNWGPESVSLTPYAKRIFETLASVALNLAQNPSPCVLPVPASSAVAQALALTEELSSGAPRLEEIARATGQSSRALTRRFSEEMGMTWSEALRRIRMIRAVEALAGSEATVTEIAMGVGYNSLSAFNVAFRDLMRMSPTQYRATFIG
ncbi:MAG: helix-turn-helix domain-containing protein [Rhizobiales bacterium]|nr:helix-turn-helix domain-containing protein [Hyphomicrobiales bacterium]